MSKVGYLLAAMIVIGSIGYLAYESESNIDQSIRRDAKSFIAKFNDYGEQIEIYADPQPPRTEIVYEEKIVEVPVTDENGTITHYENKTETVAVEKEITSDVSVQVQDRQTQKYKYCIRGHQCDITGKITLIDPITKNVIDPPYTFSYIVRCLSTNDPHITSCQAWEDRSDTIITFGDRTFAVSFTTDRDDPLGIYEAEISVTSKFTYPVDTNNDGIFDSEKPENRVVVKELKLIEQ